MDHEDGGPNVTMAKMFGAGWEDEWDRDVPGHGLRQLAEQAEQGDRSAQAALARLATTVKKAFLSMELFDGAPFFFYGAWGEMAQDYATPETGGPHYGVAISALKACGEPADIVDDDKARGLLAEATRKACCDLAQALEIDPVNMPVEAYEPLRESSNELGMLRWDSVLADKVDALGGGEGCPGNMREEIKKIAERIREEAKERWETGKPAEYFVLWLPDEKRTYPYKRPPDEKRTYPAGPVLLAMALWLGEVKLEWSIPLYQVKSMKGRDGDHYCKVGKELGTIAWAMGGAGSVEVDGDHYQKAPGITRYVTRSLAVIGGPPKRASQIVLPLELPEPDEAPLMIRVITDSQFIIPPRAAKLALFMMVTAGREPCGGTVKQLYHALNPEHTGRVLTRDLQRVAADARALIPMRVVLPDYTDVRIFDIRAPVEPGKATADQFITWYHGQNFSSIVGQDGRIKGQFVINLTGAMRLDASKEAPLLRHYLQACAGWNDAHGPGGGPFDERYTETFDIEKWAMRVNALSSQAVEYLRAQGKERRLRQKLSDDKRRARDDLARLEEVHGLLVVKELRGSRFQVLPSGGLLEAWALWRKGNARPVEDD